MPDFTNAETQPIGKVVILPRPTSLSREAGKLDPDQVPADIAAALEPEKPRDKKRDGMLIDLYGKAEVIWQQQKFTQEALARVGNTIPEPNIFIRDMKQGEKSTTSVRIDGLPRTEAKELLAPTSILRTHVSTVSQNLLPEQQMRIYRGRSPKVSDRSSDIANFDIIERITDLELVDTGDYPEATIVRKIITTRPDGMVEEKIEYQGEGTSDQLEELGLLLDEATLQAINRASKIQWAELRSKLRPDGSIKS